MLDADDLGNIVLFGGVPMIIIAIIWYLAFSVPAINECHDKGGVIVRIEGEDKCVQPPRELK